MDHSPTSSSFIFGSGIDVLYHGAHLDHINTGVAACVCKVFQWSLNSQIVRGRGTYMTSRLVRWWVYRGRKVRSFLGRRQRWHPIREKREILWWWYPVLEIWLLVYLILCQWIRILKLSNTIDHCVCTWYSALSTSFSMCYTNHD